jgi:hypothetical protein
MDPSTCNLQPSLEGYGRFTTFTTFHVVSDGYGSGVGQGIWTAATFDRPALRDADMSAHSTAFGGRNHHSGILSILSKISKTHQTNPS